MSHLAVGSHAAVRVHTGQRRGFLPIIRRAGLSPRESQHGWPWTEAEQPRAEAGGPTSGITGPTSRRSLLPMAPGEDAVCGRRTRAPDSLRAEEIEMLICHLHGD